MKLRRARIELDYDELKVLCHHYAIDKEEPTMVEINGKEYPAILHVEKTNGSFFIKLDICR
jgi:hypothetical protein